MKSTVTLLAASLALALTACGNANNNADQRPAAGMDGSGADTGATAGTAGTAGTTGAAGTAPMDTASDAMAASRADAATGVTQLAAGDRKALMAVHEVDRHEIAAAEDALAKNVEGEVRSYAEMLRNDHTRNSEATRRLMGDSGGDMGMAGTRDAGAGAGANRAGAGAGAAGTGASGAGVGATGSAAGQGTTATGTAATGAGATGGTSGAMGGTGATGAGAGMANDRELAAMKEKHDAERKRLAALEGEAFTKAWLDAMVKGHQEALAKLDNELIPGATDPSVTQHLQTTRTAIARHLEAGRKLQSGNTGNNNR